MTSLGEAMEPRSTQNRQGRPMALSRSALNLLMPNPAPASKPRRTTTLRDGITIA